MKKGLALLAALLLAAAPALAENYDGSTAALSETPVYSATGGVVQSVPVSAGCVVAEGDVLAKLREEKVFATQDGTVSSVSLKAGEKADGEVLSLAPVSRYTVYCTSEDAYSDPENMLIRSGETVWIKCSVNGTHKAVGRVTKVDSEEYTVEVTGGTLYIGEKVLIYRNSGFASADRVGVGTVISSAEEEYSAEGVILSLHVAEGDAVEKGQLLYTYSEEDALVLTATESGIVSEVKVAAGETVSKDQQIATVILRSNIGIVLTVDEYDASKFRSGATVEYRLEAYPDQGWQNAVVLGVSAVSDGQSYEVRLLPEVPPERIGMSVQVRVD